MSINLAKYRNQLLDAWKDVVSEKTPNDWALFGYEKQTNDLKVISIGDGGIDELANEFNSSKIMYAFCRVTDPNTGLPKCVFINWQGDGAPISRKGICANHIADVSNFFKGAHVTINARTEDDIDSSTVLEKVSKASASKFNFKERSDPVGNVPPVGSVYKRIQPTREINSTEREKFWEKEQAEEKQRVIIEKRKAEEEWKRLEVERKEREILESAARDKVVKERAHSISQLQEATKNADNVSRTQEYEKMQWEKQLQADVQDEKERRIRSESLRRERSHEAQNLISQRTINARAIFEQNTYASQLSSIHTNHQPKILQEFEAASRNEVATLDAREEAPHVPSTTKEDDHKPFQNNETKKSADEHEFTNTRTVLRDSETGQSLEEEEQDWEEASLKDSSKDEESLLKLLAEPSRTPPMEEINEVTNTSQQGTDLWARALYDYQAADETEISFDPDDVITQIEQIDEGWWQGRAPDGSYGLFPANYVELLID